MIRLNCESRAFCISGVFCLRFIVKFSTVWEQSFKHDMYQTCLNRYKLVRYMISYSLKKFKPLSFSVSNSILACLIVVCETPSKLFSWIPRHIFLLCVELHQFARFIAIFSFLLVLCWTCANFFNWILFIVAFSYACVELVLAFLVGFFGTSFDCRFFLVLFWTFSVRFFGISLHCCFSYVLYWTRSYLFS